MLRSKAMARAASPISASPGLPGSCADPEPARRGAAMAIGRQAQARPPATLPATSFSTVRRPIGGMGGTRWESRPDSASLADIDASVSFRYGVNKFRYVTVIPVKHALRLAFASLAVTASFAASPTTPTAAQATGSAAPESYAMADFTRVRKYDAHVHANTADPAFLEQARADGFELLSI